MPVWSDRAVIYARNPAEARTQFAEALKNPRIHSIALLLRSRSTTHFREGDEFTILSENSVQLRWLDDQYYHGVRIAWDWINQRHLALYKVPTGSEDRWVWPAALSSNLRTYQMLHGFIADKRTRETTVFLRVPDEHVISLWDVRNVRPFTCDYGEVVRILYKLFSYLADIFHSQQLCVVRLNPSLVKLALSNDGLFIPMFGDLSEAREVTPDTPELKNQDVRNLATAIISTMYGHSCRGMDVNEALTLLNSGSPLDNVLKEALIGSLSAREMAFKLSQLDTSNPIQEMRVNRSQQIEPSAAVTRIPQDYISSLSCSGLSADQGEIQQESLENYDVRASLRSQESTAGAVGGSVSNLHSLMAVNLTNQKSVSIQVQETATDPPEQSPPPLDAPVKVSDFQAISKDFEGNPGTEDDTSRGVLTAREARNPEMRRVETSGFVSGSRSQSQLEDNNGISSHLGKTDAPCDVDDNGETNPHCDEAALTACTDDIEHDSTSDDASSDGN